MNWKSTTKLIPRVESGAPFVVASPLRVLCNVVIAIAKKESGSLGVEKGSPPRFCLESDRFECTD